jgi:hypothetical protein
MLIIVMARVLVKLPELVSQNTLISLNAEVGYETIPG